MGGLRRVRRVRFAPVVRDVCVYDVLHDLYFRDAASELGGRRNCNAAQ